MSDLKSAIPVVRESLVAILRIRLARPEKMKKGKVKPARFEAIFTGSAFCIVADRYLVTACHVIKDGEQRNPKDKFYAFTVPQNGDMAYCFPVIAFPIERQDVDMAILEVGPCTTPGMRIPAIPVLFALQADGSRVVTTGFPAPKIVGFNVDQEGNYMGGNFFLKSHANEGIVSGHYMFGGVQIYELNVGWHHGESGGPIIALTDPPAVFSVMQHYINIESPHGVVAGPHRGYALFAIEQELTNLGVTSLVYR